MAGIGVAVAIIRNDEVLLIQREDFEVWGLPGGEVDDGESLAQAAIREAYEETGLKIALTRLVGVYSIPEFRLLNAHNALFAGEIIGSELQTHSNETLDARFFSLDNLPESLMWWHEQRIRDALNGIGGSTAWTQHVPTLASYSRRELYALRDQSGLPKPEFFHQYAPRGTEKQEIIP
jgi:ADP-ribose pyrophosphatase YjhB (NUDIX family)